MNQKAQIIVDLILKTAERDDSWPRELEGWRDRAKATLENPHSFDLPPPGFREACLEAARILEGMGYQIDEPDINKALAKRRWGMTPKLDEFGKPTRLPPANREQSIRFVAFHVGFRSCGWFGPCSARG